MHDIFPLAMYACIPLFEQFKKRGIECLQENVSKKIRTLLFQHHF
jgi:hypothetical protein